MMKALINSAATLSQLKGAEYAKIICNENAIITANKTGVSGINIIVDSCDNKLKNKTFGIFLDSVFSQAYQLTCLDKEGKEENKEAIVDVILGIDGQPNSISLIGNGFTFCVRLLPEKSLPSSLVSFNKNIIDAAPYLNVQVDDSFAGRLKKFSRVGSDYLDVTIFNDSLMFSTSSKGVSGSLSVCRCADLSGSFVAQQYYLREVVEVAAFACDTYSKASIEFIKINTSHCIIVSGKDADKTFRALFTSIKRS